MRTNSENLVVPILAIHVARAHVTPVMGPNFDYIQPELETYFVTPEGSRGGRSEERLSFSEAINRMTF